MSKKYDYIVYIGRFQPPHNAHLQIIDQAKQLASKVIVLVGSPNKPRSIKNPFTFHEREHLLISVLVDIYKDTSGFRISKVNDNLYNDDLWIKNVQSEVDSITESGQWTDYPPKVALIGHDKDDSSFYLKFFPQWDFIAVEPNDHSKEIHATDMRELLFDDSVSKMNYLKGVVHPTVFTSMMHFRTKPEWAQLNEEYKFIQKYKKDWLSAPYAPTFVTTDAVVIQDGHVLMVERGANPGKGLYALPGGFLNQNERIIDGAIRELVEETKIKVPEQVLRGSIQSSHVFDHPDRSLRGRTVTHAFFIKLKSTGSLPKVKGSDDAAKAVWISLSEFDSMEDRVFEDHWHIVKHFVGD